MPYRRTAIRGFQEFGGLYAGRWREVFPGRIERICGLEDLLVKAGNGGTSAKSLADAAYGDESTLPELPLQV